MENKCEKCEGYPQGCAGVATGTCPAEAKPAPEKRVFRFGQFAFATREEFEALITKLWAEGKTPTVTVEVL